MPARLFLVVMVGLLVLSATMRARDENINPVNHALTEEECSACHLAFPAAMLTSTSWNHLMSSLESHFGEDASLDEESITAITDYLISSSADSSWTGNRFSRGQKNDWPIRITETDHWLREHRNLSFKDASNSEDIIRSNCVACHGNAVNRGPAPIRVKTPMESVYLIVIYKEYYSQNFLESEKNPLATYS